MSVHPYFFYLNALFAAVLAIGVAFGTQRTIPRLSFVVGMIALCFEATLEGWHAMKATATINLMLETWCTAALVSLPGPWLLFSFCYARDRVAPWIHKNILIIFAVMLLPGLSVFLFHDLLLGQPSAAQAADGAIPLGPVGLTAHLYVLVGALGILTNLEHTYRAAIGTMRWRIKYMILGLAVFFSVRAYASTQALLFREIDPSWIDIGAFGFLGSLILICRSLLRSGHFEIAVYPSPAVLRSSITVVIAGIYLLVVGVLAKIVAMLGGTSSFTLKAFVVFVGLVALAIILQSDRVRLWVRHFVSRHFQRPLFDYRSIWRLFAEQTGQAKTEEELGSRVVRLLADIFNALSINVWVTTGQPVSLRLLTSTTLPGQQTKALSISLVDTADAIAYFRKNPSPLDLDTSKHPWAANIASCHPGEFRHGGHRLCAPLVSSGEVIGFIIVGDRVSGTIFTEQDSDLLRSIAEHTAATLVNLRLSLHILETRQFEAFQTMATFFVHDLKNSASTLSLMLRNLPDNFDNPEFRTDALRGISRTVDHINHLIGRLGELRHEITIETRAGDLNLLAQQVADDCAAKLQGRFTLALTELPPALFDRSQMTRVITNLLINAVEAIGPDGHVTLTTAVSGHQAKISIADNGCGMPPEFIARSLFRPFQTTKKRGLGIGMFQSKMIVEAHRGNITVESTQGKGTTFHVTLPLASTRTPSPSSRALSP